MSRVTIDYDYQKRDNVKILKTDSNKINLNIIDNWYGSKESKLLYENKTRKKAKTY
jgi:hypothetical protein